METKTTIRTAHISSSLLKIGIHNRTLNVIIFTYAVVMNYYVITVTMITVFLISLEM